MRHNCTMNTKHEVILCIHKMTFFRRTILSCVFWPSTEKYRRWINIVRYTCRVVHTVYPLALIWELKIRCELRTWCSKFTMELTQWCPLALLKHAEKKKLLAACVLVIPFATSNFVQCLFVTNRRHLSHSRSHFVHRAVKNDTVKATPATRL